MMHDVLYSKQHALCGAMAEQKRINTSKLLNNNYFTADTFENFGSTKISVSSDISDQYRETFDEDFTLTNDRKDTAEKILEIWKASPYYEQYSSEEWGIKKIPKKDICEIFYYVKENLEKQKTLSAFEIVIAINEFFDFNYEYIYQNVMSPKMVMEIFEDYYTNMGKKNKIDEIASEPLF